MTLSIPSVGRDVWCFIVACYWRSFDGWHGRDHEPARGTGGHFLFDRLQVRQVAIKDVPIVADHVGKQACRDAQCRREDNTDVAKRHLVEIRVGDDQREMPAQGAK